MKNERFLSKYDGKKLGWFRWWKELLVMIAVLAVVFNFVVGVARVDGHSMDTTLRSGQPVLFLRLNKSPKAGDIIAIRMTSGEGYVKRVVGVPGDVVDIHDGKVFVNGEELDEPYIHDATEPQVSQIAYPYEVEEDRYFVLGDNRPVSIDSRSFGTILDRQILGVIVGH